MAKSPHRKHLEKALGTTTTDAIAGLAREVAEDVVEAYMANEDNLQALRNRLADLIAERGADDPEVRSAVQTVVTASREHDATAATDEAAVAEDTARTEAAEQAVEALEQASEDAGSQPEPESAPEPSDEVDTPASTPGAEPNSNADIAAMVFRHEAILASGNPVDPRPPSRLDDIEGCMDQHEGVIASAFAHARASITSTGNVVSGAVQLVVYTAVAFVTTFIITMLVVWATPLTWDWTNMLGASAIVAAFVLLILIVNWARNWQPNQIEILSYADVAAIVAVDNQRRAASNDDNVGLEVVAAPVVDTRRQASADASAHAHAGV
ncbi:MAG TPA: NADH-quinone oxidoreductase subunit J [Candidatus Saccharibacteria bacterium]|nr:NADH-quinone oxidoreductase subunit J [Candidatus Saccharibacteria bacterium]